MILHLVNKSPYSHGCLQESLKYLGEQDEVLLLEDGVIACIESPALPNGFIEVVQQNKVYALTPDLVARGLADKVMSNIKVIDDQGFVELTLKHHKSMSWF